MGSLILLTASAAAFLPTALGQAFFVQYSPGGDDTSVQRIDPIVSPGGVSEHVHQLFGSSGLASTLSYESLQASGCSTLGSAAGQQNTQDKSIYWVPSLYMEANNGGYIRVPTNGHKTYYIDTGYGEKVEPFDFPNGFQMLGGSPTNRGPVTNGAITWTCYSGGAANEGSQGAFPQGVSTCETYPYLNAEIEFPHCWNGNDLDPADPTAHMAYPDGGDPRGGTCPSSHPKRLPHLFIETFYMLDSNIASQAKPNSFVLSQGDNTGYGQHADFMNGWDSGAISDLLATCPPMNEDVGICPAFKGGSPTSSCSLPVQFKENVDTPSPYLPGCNPITDQNPAPKYQIGPLGTTSDQCPIVSGSDSSPEVAPSAPESPPPVVNAPPSNAGDTANYVTATINGEVVSWENPSRRTPGPAPASPFDAGSASKRDYLRRRHVHRHGHARGSW